MAYFSSVAALSLNTISPHTGRHYEFKLSSVTQVLSPLDVDLCQRNDALYECGADGTPRDPRRGPRGAKRPQPLSSTMLGKTPVQEALRHHADRPVPLSAATFEPPTPVAAPAPQEAPASLAAEKVVVEAKPKAKKAKKATKKKAKKTSKQKASKKTEPSAEE